MLRSPLLGEFVTERASERERAREEGNGNKEENKQSSLEASEFQLRLANLATWR